MLIKLAKRVCGIEHLYFQWHIWSHFEKDAKGFEGESPV